MATAGLVAAGLAGLVSDHYRMVEFAGTYKWDWIGIGWRDL